MAPLTGAAHGSPVRATAQRLPSDPRPGGPPATVHVRLSDLAPGSVVSSRSARNTAAKVRPPANFLPL